jgi:hypothetical protein
MRPPQPHTFPVALADALHVALALFQLGFSACVSVVLFRLAAWQRRYEGMEAELQDTANLLVEERFRALATEVRTHVQSFVGTLDEMRSRVSAGDGVIRDLTDRDQRIELALGARIETLKDWIRDNSANKADLARHEQVTGRKLELVERHLVELSNTVAAMSGRV